MVLLLWLTRKTVPASLRSSRIRSSERTRNLRSPVASASSIMSTSWFLAAAIEKRRRAAMPDEYVRIGSVMKSPFSLIPEKSTMSLYRARISSRLMPIARPPSTTFRSPVRSLIRAALTPSSDG